MIRFALAVIAAFSLASAAAAQPPAGLTLAPGEAVVVQVDAGGAIARVVSRGAAHWTALDVAAARQLVATPIPDGPVPYGTPVPAAPGIPAAPAIEANVIRFKFLSIAGAHSLLVVENGYGRGFVYRARMTRGDRTSATDVCLVVPGRSGFEHWAFVIDRIEVSDFRFVPWREGDSVPCT